MIVDYFWTSQSFFLSSNWFFECRHQFIDKPIIIVEPAVPSTLLLGLGSKLYPSNMQGMLNEDVINSCRIFLKKGFAGKVVQRLLSKHILPPFCQQTDAADHLALVCWHLSGAHVRWGVSSHVGQLTGCLVWRVFPCWLLRCCVWSVSASSGIRLKYFATHPSPLVVYPS